MNSKALRKGWFRRRAWTLVIALPPLGACLAAEPGSPQGQGGTRTIPAAPAFAPSSSRAGMPGTFPPVLRGGSGSLAAAPASDPATADLPTLPDLSAIGIRGSAPSSAFAPAPAPASAPVLAPAPVAEPAPPAVAPAPTVASGAGSDLLKTLDEDVEPAACATCGGGHSKLDGGPFHALMDGAGPCIPGQKPCYLPFESDHVVAHFLNNLYQCLCCPDPCYQPRWVPAANASFFADYARPRTVTRVRYDNLSNMTFPDRNQFFFSGMPINRSGPNPVLNPYLVANSTARLQQLYLYTEIAAERGSFFIEYPYRQVNPAFSPTQAGFSDLNFGTKSLLYDCEMLQVSFQFRTYTPTGNASQLLGTGHWSLDPSLLTSLKLGPSTYFQGQFGNWIPLGGNQQLNGGIFYWFMSFNHVLFEPTPDSPLIGTLEMTGWSFEDGGYTRPLAFPDRPNAPRIRNTGGGVSYFNIGPGLRWSICNTMDIGGAVTFATTNLHWADPWFRFEVRFLF